MPPPAIQLDHVNFWYNRGKPNESQALRDVSCEIQPGEYVSFFGPSGSGKTTLLYLISGIEQGQDGKILVSGRDISGFSQRELAVFRQIGVGIVFQQFNLIPSLMVVDNVALPMTFFGVSLAKRREAAMQLLKRLDIEHLAERFPHELSGGQQQRVGIARALANDPPIIIADEPIGNLDSANANNVLAFLKELNEKDHKTVIMVTHEAWSLRDAQKIFYLKDGIIVKTEDSADEPAAVSLSQHLYREWAGAEAEKDALSMALTHLFLRGYSSEETKRFAFFLTQRLANNIDGEVFENLLHRPYRLGGVGFWKVRAAKIAKFVNDIIERRHEIAEVFNDIEHYPEVSLTSEVERIREWLLEEYRGQIDETQKARLNEIINERLRNIITSEMFKKVLSLEKKKFGVGLSLRTAQRVFERMEFALENEAEIVTNLAGPGPAGR
ncbi:MAG TPA: ABC transporter ATP-binding protein [Candidatus Paceibacterota bacterium]|nr:ABC transporter ATP-binding protein [Candidatus Paceibacterota bacterium]